MNFGSWRPDTVGRNTDFASEALNVFPKAGGRSPWPLLVAASAALGAACKGAFVARDPSTGAIAVFAGSSVALYKFTNVTTWEVVTRSSGVAYAVAANDFWQFRQFGATIIAVARGNAPQYYTLGSSTDFEPLAGSPPQAALIEIVGDFVVLGDLDTATIGRSSIIWSGLNDMTHWTIGQKFCDRNYFPDGDFVTGLTALETGLIIQQNAVRSVQRVPTRSVFEFGKIEAMQGTNSPYSIIQHQGTAFYYGVDGFIASAAGAFSGEVGVDYIDDWFNAEADLTRLHTIVGALDPTRTRLFWAFPSVGNASTTLNRIVGFDKKLEEWFHANVETEYIFSGATAGTTTEGDSSILDNFPDNLVDSELGLGGVPNLAAFGSDHIMKFFAGQAMAATLRTAIVQPLKQRFYVNGFTLIGDASTATGRVGVAESAQEAVSFKPLYAVKTRHGRIPARASGRYLQLEVQIPAQAVWTEIQGVEPDVIDDGEQ